MSISGNDFFFGLYLKLHRSTLAAARSSTQLSKCGLLFKKFGVEVTEVNDLLTRNQTTQTGRPTQTSSPSTYSFA